MNFDVVTLFPGLFGGPLDDTILARARRSGRIGVRIHDLRRWGVGPHRQVDDAPYGGGDGMVLRPEPFFEAVDWVRRSHPADRERVVLLTPRGAPLDDRAARRLAGYERLILLCGRYEGIDERVGDLADEELSIGDVVLTGGELPALVVIDAVSRFVGGVLGADGAADRDSFAGGRLEAPQYTRPASYRGKKVPEVLRRGDHAAIEAWRREESDRATKNMRPDLVAGSGVKGTGPGR